MHGAQMTSWLGKTDIPTGVNSMAETIKKTTAKKSHLEISCNIWKTNSGKTIITSLGPSTEWPLGSYLSTLKENL
jgi:hypothetical protein